MSVAGKMAADDSVRRCLLADLDEPSLMRRADDGKAAILQALRHQQRRRRNFIRADIARCGGATDERETSQDIEYESSCLHDGTVRYIKIESFLSRRRYCGRSELSRLEL
jgi:hypothetical protein